MNAPFKSYLDGYRPVLQASGHAPGKRNWTVLSIYYDPTDAQPWQAEIVGDTVVDFQEVRIKRKRFRSLSQALGFTSFDFDSPLYADLRAQAIEFLERGEHLAGTITIKSGSLGPGEYAQLRDMLGRSDLRPVAIISDVERLPPILRTGFDGAGGLRGALEWLYPGVTGVLELGKAFCADFGLAPHLLDDALEYDAGHRGIFDMPVGPEEFRDRFEWVKTFIASLRFFDREAFQANRAAG